MPSTVVLQQCTSYDRDELDRAITEMLSMLPEWKGLFRGKPVVMLKPNLLTANPPEKAVNTHPLFVAAVARALRGVHSGRILLGDGPALGTTRSVCRKLGLPDLLQGLGVELVDFTETIPVSGGGGFGTIDLARPLVEADLVINLPKVKTHAQMGLTIGVKNLYGAIVGLEKSQRHLTAGRDSALFARMILEIFTRVRPALTLADGVIGMEGNGPSNGRPRKLGLLAASADTVALDRVLAHVLGFSTAQVPILQQALAEGIPGARLEEVRIVGARPEAVQQRDWKPATPVGTESIVLPGILARPLRGRLVPRPVFKHEICTRCGTCIEHCAARALTLGPRGLRHPGPRGSDLAMVLDLSACIRCFCCQELCPVGAVEVGEGRLVRLLRRAGLMSRRRP